MMRPIGILGGMSWVSTAHYYATLNRMVAERMGGLHSARILLNSVDFAPIARMQREDDWSGAGAVLAEAAQGLERAGAGLIVIAANTMHLVADQVASAVDLPLIHICRSPPRSASHRCHGRSSPPSSASCWSTCCWSKA